MNLIMMMKMMMWQMKWNTNQLTANIRRLVRKKKPLPLTAIKSETMTSLSLLSCRTKKMRKIIKFKIYILKSAVKNKIDWIVGMVVNKIKLQIKITWTWLNIEL